MDKNTESIIDVVTVDEKKNKTKNYYTQGSNAQILCI